MATWYDHDAYAFLEGTQEMTNTEKGIYITLMNHQFCRGGYLPVELGHVATLVGVTLGVGHFEEEAFLRVVEAKFTAHKRGYYNPRMLRTVRQIDRRVRQKRAAGRKGGRARADQLAKTGRSAKKKPRKKAAAPAMPEVLDTPAFTAKWDEWLAYRKQQRWSTKAPWQLRQLNMLAKHGPEIAMAAIENSMNQGYQGVFPEKAKAGRHGSGKGSPDGLEGAEDYGRVF